MGESPGTRVQTALQDFPPVLVQYSSPKLSKRPANPSFLQCADLLGRVAACNPSMRQQFFDATGRMRR